MKKNKNKVIYKIDSCYEKIQLQPFITCNRPSYRTICNKSVINRSYLRHNDYQNLLSTPKGFKWTGRVSGYEKKKKNSTHKLLTDDGLRKM